MRVRIDIMIEESDRHRELSDLATDEKNLYIVACTEREMSRYQDGRHGDQILIGY